MNIIAKSKLWLSLSCFFVVVSVVFLFIFGLKFGIDFTGGSLLEVKYFPREGGERPGVSEIQNQLGKLGIGNVTAQPVGEQNMILRFKDISEEKHQQILRVLSGESVEKILEEEQATSSESMVEAESAGIKLKTEIKEDGTLEIGPINSGSQKIEELRFDTVGPSIGQELKRRSIYAVIIVLIIIVLYIAWSFRKVSKPVASWKYGMAAIVALFHDVLIVMGVFALLGKFAGVEIDTAFIAALLTVLGYSVNDTIVVFDRIRENLPRSEEDFAGTVNTSLNQTIIRSLNASLSTVLVLLAIFFFGGETIKYFILALIIGIAAGTYSSIFLASPLLVFWWKRK